jgi:2-amino-4-hydroxy-6-hydroxymethyldihydropteridine diphosphokinase
MNESADAGHSATHEIHPAAVAMGSNIPPRRAALVKALSLLERPREIRIKARSRIFETEPQGGPPQGPFLNAAVLLETGLAPLDLLGRCLAVEREMGRVREGRDFPRIIDLDIIFYDNIQVDLPGLEIPHPRFRERGFVLQPLADIIPCFEDPVTNETVGNLLLRWVRAGGSPAAGSEFI